MTQLPAPFPLARLRRLRATPALRALVRENALTPSDLIWPIFLMQGTGESVPIPSMPGVSRLTVDRAVDAARLAVDRHDYKSAETQLTAVGG